MGSKALKSIASIALPILGTLAAPGIGTALGSTLGAASLGGIGGALGGGLGGAVSGRGLKGILSGAALGGAGGYLSSGGLGELGITGKGSLLGEAASGLQGPTVGGAPLNATGGGTGILGSLTNGLPTSAGTSSYSGIGSNLLSASLGTNANDDAADALLKAQQKNTELLTPFLNEKFDGSDLYNTPGYQFQLAEGTKALDAANAARGNYYSGGALQDAAKYTTGLADSTYNNAYNQFLQTQAQKIGAAGGLTNINDTAANATAGAGINNSNILSQSLAGILGGRGISNTGATLGGDNYAAILEALLKQKQTGLAA